jgi:hypothetical protein
MSNRIVAISPYFGKRAKPAAGRDDQRNVAGELIVIAVLAAGTGFMSFAIAADWLPGLIVRVSMVMGSATA